MNLNDVAARHHVTRNYDRYDTYTPKWTYEFLTNKMLDEAFATKEDVLWCLPLDNMCFAFPSNMYAVIRFDDDLLIVQTKFRYQYVNDGDYYSVALCGRPCAENYDSIRKILNWTLGVMIGRMKSLPCFEEVEVDCTPQHIEI